MPASGRFGRAGPELNLFEFEAQPVGRNLGERGPRTLTHLVRPRLDQAGPVAAHDRTGLGLEHDRRKRCGAHSPTDKEASLVTHLSCCGRALRPAKERGSLRVAFAQGLGGERLAGDRLDFGIVL